MKKLVLKTKGYFIDGVFIVEHIRITAKVINSPHNKGKHLKLGYADYTQEKTGCGGAVKPPIPPGEFGDWFCVNNEWVWFPG